MVLFEATVSFSTLNMTLHDPHNNSKCAELRVAVALTFLVAMPLCQKG